jgi:uncharacterized membrane protein
VGVFLSYIFYFIAATVSPIQRRWLATHRHNSGPVAFAFRAMLVVAACGTASLPLFARPQWHGAFGQNVLLGLVCAIFGASSFACVYTAQKHVDAGLTTLLSNLYTPVTIVLAILFLHEGLQPSQMLGTLLLLLAVIIVGKKHHLGGFRFDKYFMLMVYGGTALGIALSAERALMKTTGFTTGTLISWWSQCLGLGIATLFFSSYRGLPCLTR